MTAVTEPDTRVSTGPHPAQPAGLVDLGATSTWRVLRMAAQASPALRHGWWLVAVLALVAGAGRITAPLAVQWAIDDRLRHVEAAVGIGIAGVIAAGLASYSLNLGLHRRVETALAQLRCDGLRRVHQMPAETADTTPVADLASRVTNDLDQVSTFMQGGGVGFVTNSAQLLIATVVMCWFSPVLTIPILVIAVAMVWVMGIFHRVTSRRFDRARRDLARMQALVAESIAGAPVIRSTSTTERTAAKLDAAVLQTRDSLMRTLAPLHGSTTLGEVAISTMTVSVLLLGVWWGTHDLGAGEPARISAGQVVAMLFLVTLFVRPLQFLVQNLVEAQNALTGWRRGLELVNTPSAVVVDGIDLPPGPVSVELVQVTARYGAGPAALDRVSVRIQAGSRIAVVGRTGSGKSTFAKVITRRLGVAEGRVELGAIPAPEVTDASLARRVVVIGQEPFLFAGSVRDNLLTGDPTASDDRLVQIADRLGVGAWLGSLPQGLDTEVGVGGSRLSVGERQLVALIRTAASSPDLIVLDEATSGVDPATDVAVTDAMPALASGRTTISIAHRMATAVEADRVLVFDAGRIVQDGPHEELVAEPGPYAELFAAWGSH